MKILHLLPYLPTPAHSGGAIRMFHILKHLYDHHDVTVAGYHETGNLNEFSLRFPDLEPLHIIRRRKVQYRRLLQIYSLFTSHSYWYNWSKSARLEEMVNELLYKGDYDVVLAEFASMGHFHLETDALRILDAHNVEYDNFRRMSLLKWSGIRKKFYTREYHKSYKEEIEAFRKQDAIFTTSRRDRQLIRKDVTDVPQFVIPNGVDTSWFHPNGREPEPFSLVFTGSMNYVPNYDGMIFFLNHIFPYIKKKIPQIKIYVVGNQPPPQLKRFESDSVIITGFVEDVRPWIDRANVYVVPINMGSGTRLKVVEALSLQKPIVTTSIGCEGIDVNDEEHLLIRDNPKDFAEAVVRLLRDRSLRDQLVEAGYERVRQKYDWKVIGRSIDQALETLSATKGEKRKGRKTLEEQREQKKRRKRISFY